MRSQRTAIRPCGYSSEVIAQLRAQISSAAARDAAGPFNTANAVSKIALDRLIAQLATELTGTGVTVCSLHPDEIASRMRDDIAAQSAVDARLAGWTRWADRTADHGDDPAVVAAWARDCWTTGNNHLV